LTSTSLLSEGRRHDLGQDDLATPLADLNDEGDGAPGRDVLEKTNARWPSLSAVAIGAPLTAPAPQRSHDAPCLIASGLPLGTYTMAP